MPVLNREYHQAVLQPLRRRPFLYFRIWAACVDHMHPKIGEVLLGRDELAAAVGVKRTRLSTVMHELEDIDAILRRQEPSPGTRDPGRVRYFVPLEGVLPR